MLYSVPITNEPAVTVTSVFVQLTASVTTITADAAGAVPKVIT